MRFSFFSSFKSNTPQNCDQGTWERFVSVMRIISNVKGHKPTKYETQHTTNNTNKPQTMISCAIYPPNVTRSNKSVLGWDFVMLDIDSGITDINEVFDRFDQFNCIIYSSPNCTKENIKVRVCIKLHKFAPKEVLSQVWHGCNELSSGLVDVQTKDKSRMMYPPARYDNQGNLYYHIFKEFKGLDLDWEQLIKLYPSPKENERFIQSNKLSGLKRKIYLKTKKIPSFNILSKKCPFVYDNMIDEYRLTPAGEHHLALYRFMVKCCYNAKRIDYPLSIDELVDLAKQLDDIDGGFYTDKKFYDSGADALEYVGI